MNFEKLRKNLRRRKDYNLLCTIKECIEMYVEETEEVNETLKEKQENILIPDGSQFKLEEKLGRNEQYTDDQTKRIIQNLVIILEMTETRLDNKDFELIYTCANDSLVRLQGANHYLDEQDDTETNNSLICQWCEYAINHERNTKSDNTNVCEFCEHNDCFKHRKTKECWEIIR